MNILAFLILFSVALTVLIGIFVFLSKPKAATNKSFLLMTAAVTLWLLVNFLVVAVPDNIIIQRSITPVSVAMYLSILLFISIYEVVRPKIGRIMHTMLALSLPLFIFSYTDFNVMELQNGHYTLGILYPYYIFFTLLMTLVIFLSIIKNRKYQTKKQQIKTRIFYHGLIISVSTGVTMGLLAPVIGLDYISNYTFMSVNIFLIYTAISIIKYRSLDVRYYIFRLLSYFLTVAITTFVLIALLIFISALILNIRDFRPAVMTTYILTYVIAILLFNPIKKIIDRLTNKIFLQNSYSSQLVAAKISSYATNNINIDKIQKYTIKLLDSSIYPDLYSFITLSAKGKHKQLSNFSNPSLLEGLIEDLYSIKKIKVTIVEDLAEHRAIKHKLNKLKMEVVIKISTSSNIIGYILLGEKRNGREYGDYDIKFLEQISNDLALALENANRYEEIQAFNETLQHKINEATKALKRNNAKLVALDDAKDEFISMASHQLRTPLTSVKGYISMMLEEDLGKINATQRKALKEAFDSSQRMVFLISDFLNVSRIRTGKFLFEPQKTNLTEIIDQEIKQLKEMAIVRGQTINYTAPKAFPIVMLDENKTRQVMMNMLDNAIFYTPQNGNIEISLEKTKTEIIYRVRDSGIGVPKNVHHRLFTKFFRADNAKRARPDGTGLGLFMAQKIITAQGGRVIFKSVEGEGSTFGFRFPLEKVLPLVDNKDNHKV